MYLSLYFYAVALFLSISVSLSVSLSCVTLQEDLLDSLRQEEEREKAKKVDIVEFSLQPLPLEDYHGHADDDDFVCDICNLSVDTQPLLDRHMKIKHCWKVSNNDEAAGNTADRGNVASETVSSLETAIARKVEATDRARFCCLFCAFTVDNQLSVENHIEAGIYIFIEPQLIAIPILRRKISIRKLKRKIEGMERKNGKRKKGPVYSIQRGWGIRYF